MKELIYLDTNFLHSYVAQAHDGLPINISHENVEEIRDTKELEEGEKSGAYIEGSFKFGELEIPLIFKSPTGTIKTRLQPGLFSSERVSLSQLESGKEIISKQLHDNALNQFETFLTQEELLCEITDDDLVGKFIKFKSEFKIIDFEYLLNVIKPETLVEFMFTDEEKQLDELKKQAENKPQGKEKAITKGVYQEFKNKLRRQKDEYKEQFSFIEKALKYLEDILPTQSFILMDNIIVPLKNECLREKSSELMFKYGGGTSSLKITMVGKVTSKIDSVEAPELNGVDGFIRFPELINAVLHSLGVLNKDDLVVSPVAIYFE